MTNLWHKHRSSAGGFCIGCWEPHKRWSPAVVEYPCDVVQLLVAATDMLDGPGGYVDRAMRLRAVLSGLPETPGEPK